MQDLFDNVVFRTRGQGCVVSCAAPRLGTAFWPDISAVARELGFNGLQTGLANDTVLQARLLCALAERVPHAKAFKPALIGFAPRPGWMHFLDEYRSSQSFICFKGPRSRAAVLGALVSLASRVRRSARIETRYEGWDLLDDWVVGRQQVAEALRSLHETKQCQLAVTCFSNLGHVPEDFWAFVYDRPRVRIGWVATDLAGLTGMDAFEAYRRQSEALRNLELLSEQGAHVQVALPVTAANIRILSELVQTLTDVTRGGNIEIEPTTRQLDDATAGRSGDEKLKAERADRATVEGPDGETAGPPAVEDYVAAVLAVYRNPRIPLRRVSPLSWVADRIDAEYPLVSSAEAAGAAIAVVPNGDLYPGEAFIGREEWCLGRALDEPETIRWERLDAVPEAFGNHSKPAACQTCDWRYRCGGVDCVTQVQIEKLKAETGKEEMRAGSAEGNRLFGLYCAPRKALFEEMLWDSVTAAAEGQTKRSRELVELHDTGIEFKPAGTWCQKS